MTLQGLLENAHLDALGLLDERELAEFNAAFAAASPGVQAHVRAEQARWANLDFLLPRVEPPEYLRARVVAAVQAAMLETEAGTESSEIVMRPSVRVARGWRTSSMGLVGVCVVLGAAFLSVMGQNEEMRRNMVTPDVQREVFSALGGDEMNDMFFSPATRRVAFTAVEPGFRGQGSVLVNFDWKEARIVFRDLPERSGQTYRIAMVDDSGKVGQQVAEVPAAGSRGLRFLNLSTKSLHAGARIALVAAVNGAEASTGTILMVARV